MNPSENQLKIEVFQPEVSGAIRQATLEDLKKWVQEGKLQPNHKVRIKDLSWVEAKKIPALQKLFEEKNNPSQTEPPPTAFINPPPKTFTPSSTYTPPTPSFHTNSGKPSDAFFNNSQSNQFAQSEKDKTSVFPSAKSFPGTDNPLKFQPAKIHSFTVGKVNSESVNTTPKETENSHNAKAENTAEPSLPFKILEAKSKAKAENVEADVVEQSNQKIAKTSVNKKKEVSSKPIEAASAPRKKSINLKSVAVFLGGSVLMFILAAGISYFWVYMLKGEIEVNEKNLPELSNLEDKLTSDKIEARLKAAEKEKSLKNAGDKNAIAGQPVDVSQEIAALEKNHTEQRDKLIENYRTTAQENEFYVMFPFTFVILMFAFSIAQIFYGKSSQAKEAESLSHASLSPTKVVAQNTNNEAGNADRKIQKAENSKLSEEAEASPTEKNSGEIHRSSPAEAVAADKSHSAVKCLLHREEDAKFSCKGCSNNFCSECTKTFDGVENCCPFCQLECQPVVSKQNAQQATQEDKKKPSLLELNKNSNFTMYEYKDERTRKLGVIPAFVISLLMSGSLAVFWVYQITPYLENRGKDVAQKTQNQNQDPAKSGVANAFEQSGFNDQANSSSTKQSNADTGAQADNNAVTPAAPNKVPSNLAPGEIDENLCVDPSTNEEFDCSVEKNPELRRALHEQAVKVKSVEKARSEIKEKTTLILSLISPTAREELRKAKEAKTPPDPEAAARAEREKQHFIRVFIGSFCVLFLLLLATRFLGKDKKLS